MLDPRLRGKPVEIVGSVETFGAWFFAIDVLARGNCLPHGLSAPVRRLCVEIDRVRGIRERAVEIGGPGQSARLSRQRFELPGVAAYQHGARQDDLAAGNLDATLLNNRDDR